MTTPLAQPPKKQDARFDDWIFRLWKRLTRTSSTELGLGTMADQNADAVAITGGAVSADLTGSTGLPISTGVSGLGTGIATALAVNTGSAGAPVLFNGALGTPSSGTVTNLTGTASININGTVGATTPATGAFTTLTASSTITASGAVTGTRFIPSGSTVPTNGLYLPAANTIGWATNSTLRGVIDSNGTAIVGHSSALSPGAYDPKFQVVGTTYKASSSISRFSNDTGGPHLLLSKSRGTTAGSYTVVQSGDDVGTIRWTAADGTDDVSTVAMITVQIDGTPGANDVPGRIIFSTTADGASNATERMRIDSSGHISAGADNTQTLGTAAKRWSVVYAGTGTINTSDANEKQQVTDLSVTERLVAVAIQGLIKKFKFNDAVATKGASARWHIGVLAQDVEAAFAARGLSASDYGLFCEDTWTDDEGIAHTRKGVRYEELLAFVIAVL